MNPQPLDLPPDATLYRRIHPAQWKPSEDRPARAQFQLRPDEAGISLYIASGCSPDDVLDGFPRYGLVALYAGDFARLGFEIWLVADATDSHPIRPMAHAEARYGHGERIPGRILTELARLAAARWIRRPG